MEQDALSTSIESFFDDLIATLQNDVPLDLLPAVSGADGVMGDIITQLQATRDAILAAVNAVDLSLIDPNDHEARATALRDALNSAGLGFLSAATGSEADEVAITLGDTLTANLVDLAGSVDLGFPGLGLDIESSVDIDATAGFAFELAFDVSDAASDPLTALSFTDGVDPEFTLGLIGDFDFSGGAQLGLLGVTVETDPAVIDELTLQIALDIDPGVIGTGGGAAATATVSGGLNADIVVETESFGIGLLPQIRAALAVGLNLEETDLLGGGLPDITPSFALNEVSVRSDALASLFDGVLGELLSIVDVFPLKQLRELFGKKIPVISEFSEINTFQDLVELWSNGNAALDFLVTIVNIAEFIDALSDLGSDEGLVLGSLSLDGESLSNLIDGGDIGFEELFPDLPSPGDAILDALEGIDTGFADVIDLEGLELPFLTQGPQILAQLLLNGVSVAEEGITFIQYGVPGLDFEVSKEVAFRIFGPLVVTIGGGFTAGVDINVGYSSKGIFAENPSFLDGFFIGADPDGEGGFDPIAETSLTLEAGLALDAVLVRAGISGGITGTLGINLGGQDAQGRSHLGDLPLPCIFGDIEGALEAFVKASLRVGFGPFSVTISKVLADAVLAQFNFAPCEGPHGSSSPDVEIDDAELATLVDAGTGTWRLNVGDDAASRNLPGPTDEDPSIPETDIDSDGNTPAIREVFTIGFPATNEGEPPRPGYAVESFGITQIIGEEPGEIVNTITGAFGVGNDVLIVDSGVDINFLLYGGANDDVLVVGALASSLFGGAGADSLSGSAQNDMIYGGDDDDVLEGGAGADGLFGGGGQDQVSYENSDAGVIFTPTGAPSEFIGQGGHAEGDILSEIEVLIGSDFGDEFVGNPNESNIIDGGRGSDTITGGNEDDLLLGAQGGDTIDGGAGTDQTSYIFSLGGVTVNLSTGLAFGGHATGDDLTSIESVQGTFYADKLTTSGNDGALDGSNGDDILRSTGGRVSLFGGGGDDIVYADGDAFGDELSGGGFYNLRPGRDLLSYRFADNGVNVDLFNGQAEAIGVPFSSPDAIAGTEVVLAPPGQAGEVIGPALGYSSFEDLEGSNGNDTLIGDNRGNSILGLNGNDTLDGGDGDDTLIGGSGADSLAGGNGSDWADYRDSFSGVTVTLGEGGFSGAGAGGSATGDTLVSDIENIFGSSRADTLTGNSDANRINPGIAILGVDSVDGLGGDDTLVLRYGDLYSAIGINQAAGEGFVFGATALTYTDIERLDLDGTAFNDIVILDDFTDDRLFLRGGDDIIGAGGGNDIVLAGSGNDVISHLGRITATSLDLPTLWIDGGEDIDTLNIDLALATEAVELAMGSPLVENPDQAEFIGTEVAITRIEIIGDVTTGIGNFDDTLIQPGDFDNVFLTFDGDDVIAPGLGSDTIIAGERPDTARGTDVDLLILDYSEALLEHVVSDFEIDIDQSFGGYAGIDASGQQTSDFVFFQDVERLFVTGTGGSDIMFGASDPEYDGPGDLLIGLAGGDTLYGGLADDTLIAGIVGGDDIIDVVYGGDGADLFVLGDETGYFYGEPSVNPPDNRDGIVIHDFDDTEGDVIQLVGSADEYAVTEFLDATFLLRGTLGDPLVDAILINYTGFDLTADYVTYVQETQIVSQSFASVEDTLSEIDQLFSELGLDLPSAAELLSAAQPDGADLAADIRDGSLAGPAVFDALRAAAEAPAPEVQASVDTDAPLVLETTGNEASVLAGIIQAQIQQVANGLNSDIVLDITTFGDPTGFAQLREGFGFQGGLAISTGVAEELAGPNLADGSIVTFEASQQLVELEAVGVVGNSQIFRADVTGLDITQLTLTDANILQGGTGRVTGSDIDTLFFSNELFEGDSAADFAVLPKLDVLNFTPAGSILELGPQRGGTIPGIELVGTLAGFLNNSVATEDVRDGTASATTNSFSTGDGGRATFLLDQPLLAGDTPTYLYVAETGAFEGLFLEVANDPASQEAGAAGDLNTDFGLPGTNGDHLGFDISLSPFIETLNGQVVEVELFQIVVAFESLLELAGPDLQDRFRVTVNGFDALVLRDGTAAVLENLALSPFGAFHPDLHQNPVGTGPMADRLRADAFTAVLTVRAPIVIGEQNTIRIEVEDRGDGFLDTAMFIASPQIEDTLADTVALFEEPSDTAPLGVFNTVEQAMSEARTGDLIRVGADTSSNPEPDGPVLVTANQLTFEANTPLPEGLQLGDSVDELTLEGEADVDVTGGTGNDTIIGNAGDNTIDGGLGDDDAFGGAGEDTLSFAALEAPSLIVGEAEFGVFVDLSDQGNRQDTGAGLDLFRGFQNVEGSAFADLLTGDRQDNVLHGNDGGDLLFGNEGDDELFGGDGFDALEGGPGADSLFGGDSVGDIATYFEATEPLVFVFGETLTQFKSGTSAQIAEDTIGEDIEGFAGSNNVSNTFDASAVTELTFFLGGAQDDTFFGGSGTDQLIGLGGNDVMYGNDGSDGLIGEGQNDDYYGGADADFFFFDGQDGDDTIHDLELGLDSIFFFGDLIEDLSQLTFSATDADGDGQQDDSMITYEAAGEQSSISAVGIEVLELQTEAIILFG